MNENKLAPLSEYNKLKWQFQLTWKPRILARDGKKCRVCEVAADERGLDLAHITPNADFVKLNGRLEDMEYSYRDDNLMVFCRECHKIQHGERAFSWDQSTRALMSRKLNLMKLPKPREMYIILQDGKAVFGHRDGHKVGRILELMKDRDVIEFLELTAKVDAKDEAAKAEADRRLRIIKTLFSEVVSKRGWTTASQVMPVTAYVKPPTKKLGPGEIMNMTRRWIEAGYIPNRKCVHPGDEPEWERHSRQQCVAGPANCVGEVLWCPDCSIIYCSFHGPRHRVAP